MSPRWRVVIQQLVSGYAYTHPCSERKARERIRQITEEGWNGRYDLAWLEVRHEGRWVRENELRIAE